MEDLYSSDTTPEILATVDGADCMAPTWQRELDHTAHTNHTDRTDHRDQVSICSELYVLIESGNRLSVPRCGVAFAASSGVTG